MIQATCLEVGKGKVTIRVWKIEIEKTDCKKLQGIEIKSQLHFTEHGNDIINKASRKVSFFI